MYIIYSWSICVCVCVMEGHVSTVVDLTSHVHNIFWWFRSTNRGTLREDSYLLTLGKRVGSSWLSLDNLKRAWRISSYARDTTNLLHISFDVSLPTFPKETDGTYRGFGEIRGRDRDPATRDGGWEETTFLISAKPEAWLKYFEDHGSQTSAMAVELACNVYH